MDPENPTLIPTSKKVPQKPDGAESRRAAEQAAREQAEADRPTHGDELNESMRRRRLEAQEATTAAALAKQQG